MCCTFVIHMNSWVFYFLSLADVMTDWYVVSSPALNSSAGVRLIALPMQASEVRCNFPGWAAAHVIYTIDSTSWLEFLINEGS